MLVLSQDLFNERSGTVISMALTSQPQRLGHPFSWPVPAGVLPRVSWVKVSQVNNLSVHRLGDRIGRLEESDLTEIVGGLLELIG